MPVRALAQTLGAKVKWDGTNSRALISKGKTEIVIPIDSSTASINGESVELDVPAEVLNGRTMVPLRFAAEAFGLTVNWDQNTRTVEISI